MKIRTQLIAAAGTAVLVAVLIVGGLVHVTQRASIGLDEQADAEQVARDLANMLALTNELAIYRSERAITQWGLRHAELHKTLQEAIDRHQPPRRELLELQATVAGLPTIFNALVQIPQGDTPFAVRRRELLFERLLIETQAVVENRFRWAIIIGQARLADQRRYTAMVLAAPASLLALLFALGLLVWLRVLRPLARMEAAVTAMQGGDLAVRCASVSADELGEASRAVDAMAMTLQNRSAALKASEERLRLIADNMPVLIAHLDEALRFTFANAHVGRVAKAAPQTLHGRSLREVIGNATHDAWVPYIAQVMQGRLVTFQTDTEGREQPRYYQISFVPDSDEAGRSRGFYAMSLDITATKLAELRVARSEQRLLDITNSLPATVAYFDMQEHCRYANATALKSQGLERDDVTGMTLRDVLGESNYAQHEPYVQEALKGRRARLDGKIDFPGRAAYFQAHLIPDRVEGGAQRGFYLMTFDITALKEAQQLQARIERQLRTITDNLPVLIAYVDAEERYLFANSTFKAWFGVDPQALLGKKVGAVLEPALYEQRRGALRLALGGQRVAFDIASPLQTGLRHLHNIYIPDIQPDGSVAGIFALCTDVTR